MLNIQFLFVRKQESGKWKFVWLDINEGLICDCNNYANIIQVRNLGKYSDTVICKWERKIM